MTQYWISTDPEVLGTSLQAESPEQAAALALTAHRLKGESVVVRWNLQVRAGEPNSAYWMCSSTEVELPRAATVSAPMPVAAPPVPAAAAPVVATPAGPPTLKPPVPTAV